MDSNGNIHPGSKNKILRFSKFLSTTKVVYLKDANREIVLVGIIRERLFGKDTIEEAMKVIDSISCQLGKTQSMKVLLGINDQEYNLIRKSLNSRNSLKGKFMSPVIALCGQNSIDSNWIGRKLTATSSNLSRISLYNPLQLFKLSYILITKSWALIRTPQALPYLRQKVPAFVDGYLNEGAECMALKIQNELDQQSCDKIIAVVPLEYFGTILDYLDNDIVDCEKRIEELESDNNGRWLIVILLYLALPFTALFKSMQLANSAKLKDLSNYETQGIALGTWVRDKRRD